MRKPILSLSKQQIDAAEASKFDGIPAYVKTKVERAARSIRPYEPVWQEALCFFDGDQFVEQSAVDGQLQRVETREGTAAKPRFRSRLVRNRYTPAIENEKAVAVSRFPVPECSAPSGNPEAINAARLAEKALIGFSQKLGVKTVVLDTLTYTFNCGAGYVWPYWDSGVGRFIEDPLTGDTLRTGEIGTWVLGPDQVLFEPGVKLRDSRWVCVRKAQPLDEVVGREGYTGPKELKADATPSLHERGRDSVSDNLVFVYHFLERPSKAHREGRWLQLAGGFQIAKERTYPCSEDLMVVHELADIRRPHRDRPMGRGEMALDTVRTYNRTVNQIIAWKNLVLNPQLLAPKGSVRTKVTEEPGIVIEFRPIGGVAPVWREVPEIPVGLFRTLDQCILDLREIFGQHELPAGLESGSAVVAINERDMSRRRAFIEGLAEFYGDFYTHLLYLMQRHYTEERLLEVKGRFGRESIPDFIGAKLMEGITVRVDPGSIEPRTRAAQEAKLILFADKGWLAGHQVMAALNAGTADTIIDAFELDVGKAQRIIQALIKMGKALEDPSIESPGPPFASPVDNHEIFMDVIGSWMKTEDYERQPDMVRQAALYLYQQHEAELIWQAMQQGAQQQMQAQALGQENAAQPGEPGQDVSRPSAESNARAMGGVPAAPS